MDKKFKVLSDVMPPEFSGSEFQGDCAYKFKDIEVVKEFYTHFPCNELNAEFHSWFGKQKNVHYWVLLKNGYAVAWNENPSKGWSFPTIKVSERIFEILMIEVNYNG